MLTQNMWCLRGYVSLDIVSNCQGRIPSRRSRVVSGVRSPCFMASRCIENVLTQVNTIRATSDAIVVKT